MIQFNFAVGCSDSGQTELPVPVIVAFAPTTKDGFQNLDEKPQCEYCYYNFTHILLYFNPNIDNRDTKSHLL